jgi:hypothetical protein
MNKYRKPGWSSIGFERCQRFRSEHISKLQQDDKNMVENHAIAQHFDHMRQVWHSE